MVDDIINWLVLISCAIHLTASKEVRTMEQKDQRRCCWPGRPIWAKTQWMNEWMDGWITTGVSKSKSIYSNNSLVILVLKTLTHAQQKKIAQQ